MPNAEKSDFAVLLIENRGLLTVSHADDLLTWAAWSFVALVATGWSDPLPGGDCTH